MIINYELKCGKSFEIGDYVYYPDLECFFLIINNDPYNFLIGYSKNYEEKYLNPNISRLFLIPKNILSLIFLIEAEKSKSREVLLECFNKHYIFNYFRDNYYISSKII